MNLVPKEILMSHLQRSEGAEEVSLPIDFFRDLLYQAMPRTWVGLTEDEREDLYCKYHDEAGYAKAGYPDGWNYEQAIEAKLKEKNT